MKDADIQATIFFLEHLNRDATVSIYLGCSYILSERRKIEVVDVAERSQKEAVGATFDNIVEAAFDARRVVDTTVDLGHDDDRNRFHCIAPDVIDPKYSSWT